MYLSINITLFFYTPLTTAIPSGSHSAEESPGQREHDHIGRELLDERPGEKRPRPSPGGHSHGQGADGDTGVQNGQEGRPGGIKLKHGTTPIAGQ